MKKIAIIGFGRFGQLLAEILASKTDVEILVISSRHQAPKHGIQFGTIADIATADVIIPTVPISVFKETLITIAPFLRKGALCIDVCSVKLYPVAVMQEVLPKTVSILATHPMFGPVSYKKNNGLSGFPIVMHPVRIQAEVYEKIKDFCQSVGLVVREIDPDLHDQYVASSQLYSFIIGHLTDRLGLKTTSIDTYWYSFLLELRQSVMSEGDALFHDLITFNPYAKKTIDDFGVSAQTLVDESN